jgi:hypothetical protein
MIFKVQDAIHAQAQRSQIYDYDVHHKISTMHIGHHRFNRIASVERIDRCIMSSETDLSRNQAIQNQRNSFLRGFPFPFNMETLQAFGALFQIPHYYRKCLHCKSKMLCNYVNEML